MKRYPSPRDIHRFHSRYQRAETGCWEWTGSKSNGYGQMTGSFGSTTAQRLSHVIFIGPIPEGFHVDHLCRNRGCVNPDHLEAVTPRENVLRGLPFRKPQRRPDYRWICKSQSLVSLRNESGLSQAELAAKAQVTLQTVLRLEAGPDLVPAQPKTLRKLSKALGCDVRSIGGAVGIEAAA